MPFKAQDARDAVAFFNSISPEVREHVFSALKHVEESAKLGKSSYTVNDMFKTVNPEEIANVLRGLGYYADVLSERTSPNAAYPFCLRIRWD